MSGTALSCPRLLFGHERAKRVRKIVELDAREAAARLRFRCGAPNAALARGVRARVEKAVAALEHGLGGYSLKRA